MSRFLLGVALGGASMMAFLGYALHSLWLRGEV